ncbi:ribonuclease P protein component [Phytophthora cinnamomi]|uniref:ribonuclease P protein component n=1 Tax=Phytophthora cinnamomi TaxID=4785 RepID=UPI00355937AD|nr:ribonuclease P protein component [Phytophthora cinnamomi]
MAFFLDDEDDGRVLEAALSFVDKFELDSVSSRTKVAAPQPLSAANASELTRRAVVNAKKRILRKTGVYSDPNRARNDRRREIAHLREEMEKLQIDLQNLQTRSRRPRQRALQPQVAMNSIPQVPGLWQVVARKQRQRREEAERENVRLKMIAARQQKVADNLSSTLQKRARQLATECSSFADVSPREQIVHVVDFCGDIGDFQGLFRQLEAARREVDIVFAANGLEKMVITPSDVHIREGDEGKYLEAFSNKVLPFKLSDTTEAAWNHFKSSEKHLGNGSIYSKAAKDLGETYTVIEAFTKEMHSNKSRADVKVKQVVRRYVEADHDLVIWVAQVAPAEIRHKILRGLTYHLRGYAKVKRSPASTPQRELSQLQCCSLITFDQEAEAFVASGDGIHSIHSKRALYTLSTLSFRAHFKTRRDNDYIAMAFFLDEGDDSVVEAALSYLDTFGPDEDTLTTTPDTDATFSPSSVSTNSSISLHMIEGGKDGVVKAWERKPDRRRRMRSVGVYGSSKKVRRNRRIEIVHLREQLEKLQIDLEVLKSQKGGDTSSKTRVAPLKHKRLSADAAATPTMSTVWENIADSQRRRREKTECENIRLKIVVEHQQKKHHKSDLGGNLGEFQGLFRHLDNAYREVDVVFASNGLNSMVFTKNEVRVRNGVRGKYVELFFNKVLPFKLKEAAEATWNHFRGAEKHMGNGTVYAKTAKGVNVADTILEDFTKEIHSNSARTDANIKQVVRRYVEPDRDVVIAVRSVSPAQVKHKMLNGLRYQVRSYAVTKKSSASTPECEVSQLQCCSLISFDEDTEVKLGPDAIRALTNFLVVSLVAKMQAHQDCIENALMDRASNSAR